MVVKNFIKIFFFVMILFGFPLFGFTQVASIEGRVFNAINNEPVPFANVVVTGTNIGAATDFDGNFKIIGIQPGFISLTVSAVGFEMKVSDEVMVTNAKTVYMEISIQETTQKLEEVVVKASVFRRSVESPVSLRNIGIKEIEKNPGGNRDISKVIQTLPGVGGTPSFRNDVIVRGGGSSENRFFLDGVEIPTINHFATQGASGGPAGIINVDFVREVDFYSGAFPSDRGNALSSIIEFTLIDGNKDKMKYRATIGASDLALTIDGPLGDKTTMIVSARRSYLQYLFSVIGLPFLPTYNDAQIKIRSRLDDKNEITFIGLGALDNNVLNLDANKTEEQRYILNYLPVNNQWNYTMGLVYKHFRKSSYDTWVISRNHLNNSIFKYAGNVEVDSLQLLDYASNEVDNRLRYENTTRLSNGLKFIYGAGLEMAQYDNRTFQKLFLNGAPLEFNYSSDFSLFRYSIFTQISKPVLDNRLMLSFGLRADGNDYSKNMRNPFNQLSPRFSLSYNLTEKLSWNFNTGRFFQPPAYTTLGYRDNNGVLVNKQNNLKYLSADHFVSGFEYRPDENARITLEGFYKNYRYYPFSVNDSIALASKGADFDVFGAEEVTSTGSGRAYGMELLVQHTDLFGFNFILSYTLVRSEFEDKKGTLIPTAWDNKHIINITGTRKLPRNWDVGFKWRFLGGSPYSPFDLSTSSIKTAWDARGQAYIDYSRYNQLRLKSYNQLDIRIDKQFYFKSWSLMAYIDIQNIFRSKADSPENYTNLDETGLPVTDPDDPTRYILRALKQDQSGSSIPTVGIMIEF